MLYIVNYTINKSKINLLNNTIKRKELIDQLKDKLVNNLVC